MKKIKSDSVRSPLVTPALVAVLALCTGCLSFFGNDTPAKSQAYTVVVPPVPKWKEIDPQSGDRAFQNTHDNATISLNSVCEAYQDQNLEDLSKSMLTGIGDIKSSKSEAKNVNRFPALETHVSALSDGKPFELLLNVVRGPRCVYDFTLVSPPATYENNKLVYDAFVESFMVESNR